MVVLEIISNGLKAVAAIFGYGQQRDAEKNTTDQRSNAEAAQIQTDKDTARAEIASGDDAALEKDVAP